MCVEPAPIRPGDPCEPLSGPHPDESECGTHADCPAEAPLCLATHLFSSYHDCRCHPVECRTDDDCPAGTACLCGEVENVGGPAQDVCGGWHPVACSHRCLPAGCRRDADCGPNGTCSASRDMCGWSVEGFYCHDPAVDECLSDEECTDGSLCRYVEGDGWRCDVVPVCD